MIHFFLEESQRVNQIRIDSIDEKAWDFLINYDYPGNIRELRNHVDRMVVLSKNHVITTEGIPILYNLKTTDDDSPSTAFTQAGIVPWREFKRRSEKEYLQWVLNQMGWNISAPPISWASAPGSCLIRLMNIIWRIRRPEDPRSRCTVSEAR